MVAVNPLPVGDAEPKMSTLLEPFTFTVVCRPVAAEPKMSMLLEQLIQALKTHPHGEAEPKISMFI
ncbi:MAG: hypothetical protein ACK553_01730, partial [Planctomycetota bacterium]